ncbi:MAG: LysM peptidoglycan-binding domain-containing protein [Opitutaceae bacterium]|nr:LysM peptidoglycan-binding domain-containing protein [Opitutaceae bacterium]
MMKKDRSSLRTLGWLVGVIAVLFSGQLQAQTYGDNQSRVQVANLREDVRVLDERTRKLSIMVEELTRENQQLRERVVRSEAVTNNQAGSFVTLSQMNQAIADIETELRQADRETIIRVTKQMESLAKQTQKALDSIAKSASVGSSSRAAKPFKFTEDYPKNGITYTVQRGDTISSIASKYQSTTKDIQNANRIPDPKQLQVGQVLFIPQR